MSDKYINVFPKNTTEYDLLQAFADRVNLMSDHIELRVETCYFDAGQGWKWTTLIAHDLRMDPGGVLSSWQALSPKEQKAILTKNESITVPLAERLAAGRSRSSRS